MKLTIYRKMLIGFGAVIFLMSAANVYLIFELRGVREATQNSFTDNLQAADLAKQMKSLLYDEEPYAQKSAVLKDVEYYKVFEQQAKLFNLYADSLQGFGLSEGKLLLASRIRNSHAWFFDVVQQSTFSSNKSDKINEEIRSDTLDALHATLEQFIKTNETSIQTSLTEINKAMASSSNAVYLLTVGALLGGIIVAVFISRTITRPIGKLIQGTEAIARGAFSPIDIRSDDEMALLAQSINEMNEKLESIDKTKTEMMHHISHELRTPLQAMTSALNLMSDQRYGTLNAEQLRLTAFLREGINKITAFSHQFLDISKIESGAMKYNFAPADVLGVLLPVVEEARLIALRKNITVTMDAITVPKIKADVEKIPQVYSNLLTNAIKYTPENGSIHVAVGRSKFGVRVSVSDTGVGIAPEDLPSVFAKFYQAKNAGQATSRGNGVGLALVKALVEAHGGRVFAESEVGEGATFTVELPAMKETMPANYTAIQQSVN
ncbi:MAG: ATP-binding protein [bacterium]